MYEAEISRGNPAALVFLVDQSSSMSLGWGGDPEMQKAEQLATILNRLLNNLVDRCSKSEGIRDYFHVAVIGYGASVGSAFAPPLAGEDLVSISRIADNPSKVEERRKKVSDGAGGLVEQTFNLAVWIDPKAENRTPMATAMAKAHEILRSWTEEHPDSFPPIVINITDGMATDRDPSGDAEALKALGTSDGSVLLFNIHVSDEPGDSITFPSSEAGLPDDFARLLFRMSSELPPFLQKAVAAEEFSVESGSRGFVFQADATEVIQFLDIGTRPDGLADDDPLDVSYLTLNSSDEPDAFEDGGARE